MANELKVKIMAVKNMCWGKGDTIAEAKRELKKQTGDIKGAALYVVPEDYYINEMGEGCGSANAKLIDGPDLRS